jgi:hypothetical protein
MRKRFYLTALAAAAVMISAEAVPSTARSYSVSLSVLLLVVRLVSGPGLPGARHAGQGC